MNAPFFPELDNALANLDAAKGSYNSSVSGISNYGNEGAAKDAMDEEFDSKLDAIKTKADEMLGSMSGGRRKQRKSRKAARKARKTRRR